MKSSKVIVNVTETEKSRILSCLDRCLREARKKRKKFTYARVARRFHALDEFRHEIESAKKENRAPQIPNARQVRYWCKKLMPRIEVDHALLPDAKWKKDYRGLTSSVSEHALFPGTRYEIDATMADVYVVSELNRNVILGRPTLYFVVDQASRMIAGLFVSLEPASWSCARQALYFAFADKVEFCARYGVEITKEEWPCFGLPSAILADRGEMIGKKPKVLTKNLGVAIEIAPPFRADAKGLVERCFGIANGELHFLPGTTIGQLRERGDSDPRLDAVLTIKEVTEILIRAALVHNNDVSFDDLLCPLTYEEDIRHTPQQFWTSHVIRRRHALRWATSDEVVAGLLPTVRASITDRGIVSRGIRYSCETALREDWFSKARHGSRTSLEARADPSWSDDLFIRTATSDGFEKCEILGSDWLFKKQHEADLTFAIEKANRHDETGASLLGSVETLDRTDEIIKTAKKEARSNSSDLSRTARLTSMRENRRTELSSAGADIGSEELVRTSNTHVVDRFLKAYTDSVGETGDVH